MTSCSGAPDAESQEVPPQEQLATKEEKISGGTFDTNNRFPYTVNFTVPIGNGTAKRCSGVLVTPTTILTASHCFVESNCDWLCDANPVSGINLSNQNVAITFSNQLGNCAAPPQHRTSWVSPLVVYDAYANDRRKRDPP